jgi:O-antigen/teichoic acid export membrane protein
MSRTSKSIRNIKYALVGQASGLLISFISRMVFVKFLGAEYLGLNGLFANILSVLSLLELGFGSALVYSMYKPLANKDTEKVKALMELYKKGYTLIGISIGILGLLLTPFLSFFISEIPEMPYIEVIYLMFVLNSSITYFFSYKRSLIIADQKRYIATLYRYVFYFILNVLQIIALILTGNYFIYLGLLIINTLLENILISRKANNLYPFLREKKTNKLPVDEMKMIFRNVRAMMYHKVGSTIVMGTDNILISKFFGLVSVGLYSNYLLIINSLNTVFGLLFQSVTASIGNLGATEKSEKKRFIFNVIDIVGFWIFGFSSISLYILFNPFISLWIGSEFLFPIEIVFIIVINFYITGLRRSVLTFRDALGLFWNDRYKPIIEIVVNFVLSIVLAKLFGLIGIFLGTFISTLTVCFWVEPFVLYKYGFKSSVKSYFIRYIKHTILLFIIGYVTWLISLLITDLSITGFLCKLVICVTVPNLLFIFVFWRTKEFQYLLSILKRRIKRSQFISI